MIWDRSGKFVNVIAISVMLLSSLMPLLSIPSHAEPATGTIEVVDQQFSTLDDPVQALINGNYVAQSFIPSRPVLSSVDLQLIYPDCDINVTIYKAKSNGFPDLANPLTNISANVFRSYGNYGFWYRFDFPDIPVIPGDTYFIRVEVVDNELHCNWVNAENGYANGSAWSFLMYEDYGFEIDYRDYFFRTYYSDTGFVPIADAGPDQEVDVNAVVYFSGTNSYDRDGQIVQYYWDIGDGTTHEGMVFQHVFEIPGTYNVSLTVTDDDGLTDTDYCSISVAELPPVNQPPVPVIEASGYLGHYYNLPANHSEVGGPVTGIVTGDSPFNHDWYGEEYYSFTRLETNLTFGNDFFPVDEGLPGDPLYFAAHWETNITIPVSGNYSFEIGSDDDSWVYIDGQMACDLGGIHALAISTHTVNLSMGPHELEIYFAERRSVQSGFYFRFLDETVQPRTKLSDFNGKVRVFANQTIELSAEQSYDPDGTIDNYTWNYGDGIFEYNATVSHAYLAQGEYNLSLSVVDNDGGVAEVALPFEIVPMTTEFEIEWNLIGAVANPVSPEESEVEYQTGTNNEKIISSGSGNNTYVICAIIIIILGCLAIFKYRKRGMRIYGK